MFWLLEGFQLKKSWHIHDFLHQYPYFSSSFFSCLSAGRRFFYNSCLLDASYSGRINCRYNSILKVQGKFVRLLCVFWAHLSDIPKNYFLFFWSSLKPLFNFPLWKQHWNCSHMVLLWFYTLCNSCAPACPKVLWLLCQLMLTTNLGWDTPSKVFQGDGALCWLVDWSNHSGLMFQPQSSEIVKQNKPVL